MITTYAVSLTVKIDNPKKVAKKEIHDALEEALISDEFVLLTLEQLLDVPADKFELDLKAL